MDSITKLTTPGSEATVREQEQSAEVSSTRMSTNNDEGLEELQDGKEGEEVTEVKEKSLLT